MNALKLSVFFAAYFAYVGVLMPFLGPWLDQRGFSAIDIGFLMLPMQISRVVGPMVWAHGMAWIHNQRLGLGLAALTASALAVGLSYWASFEALFVTLFCMSFLLAGHLPFSEALALNLAAGDPGRYGRMRLRGSVGFIVSVVGVGGGLQWAGLSTYPAWIALFLVIFTLCTFWMWPRAEAAAPRSKADSPQPVAWFSRHLALFYFSAFLMLFAHAALYGYFSILLAQLGWGSSAIGLAWALGVLAEIALFSVQGRVFARFRVESLLAFSFVLAVFRFLAIALGAASSAGIWLLQLTHAATFGVHHSASMALMRRWVPDSRQAHAQAAFSALAYGLGGSVGGVALGWVWETWGADWTFYIASFSALLGLLSAAACFAVAPPASNQSG